MIEERWLPVVGYPGYEVSDQGNMRSVDRVVAQVRRGMALKKLPDSRGYIRVGMPNNKFRLVHALVLETFVGPAPDGQECRHLDGDRKNNSLENLVWGSRKENAADRDRHGTKICGEQSHAAKLNEQAVAVIRHMKRMGVRTELLARLHGVRPMAIRRIANGLRWRHSAGAEKGGG